MTKREMLISAAVAGLMGAAVAAPGMADEKKSDKGGKAAKDKNVPCYGVNKCGGHGKCSGKGHECAGSNKCKGQGWLPMPKESCLAIEGGSLTPVEAKKEEKK
ncbi:MAG: hypothetical protein HY078_11375 [Elusimicrobia bacterium]|nr:hypothetical protein [Elusimicrobiota bacterium]